ncbi:F0F1 ATP synthase subunit alpha [Candidatus Daviesbacteria bacterium]|nr:F0F1 ATP synthase subunit alpha [Candidatus Daviesbacteria bacterium]
MDQTLTVQEVGFVKSIKDFLVYLDGLPSVRINDIVVSDNGTRGLISSLLPDRVEMLLLDENPVQPGQVFHKIGQGMGLPVGDFLLGRAINPLAIPVDGKGPLAKTRAETYVELDKEALPIDAREFIDQQFDTGITMVDTLIPLGKGQRELVIGDARSGKTNFLINTIINQRSSQVVCIYAAIGKPLPDVKSLIEILTDEKALARTIIVAASSTDIAPLIYLTPQTALAIADYFQSLGKDVLVILDDMSNHAKIYREISLLSNKPPGRESYPGDIFYQHSHLLEKGGNFKKEVGGGSITVLPVIELNLNDFTTFIPTNIMAMTDGHLMFKSSLYNQGQRPAIDISLSVSRVGQQTQHRVPNMLATRVKQVLAEAVQLETLRSFSFELPYETQLILKQRGMIEALTKQPALGLVPKEVQTILLALPFTKFLKDKDKEFVVANQEKLIKAFETDPDLKQITTTVFTLKTDEELIAKLEGIADQLNTLTGVQSQTDTLTNRPTDTPNHGGK